MIFKNRSLSSIRTPIDVRHRRLALSAPGPRTAPGHAAAPVGDVIAGHTAGVERAHGQAARPARPPIDWAATMPTASPTSTGLPVAIEPPSTSLQIPVADVQVRALRTLILPDAASTSCLQRRVAEVVAPGDDPGRRPDPRRPPPRTARTPTCGCSGADDPSVAGLLGDRHDDRALGAAVDLADDDVLRHVHQPPGQVTRVGGPQRGVRQTLAGAVSGEKYSSTDRPSRKFALIGRGMDSPFGLATRPRMPASCRTWVMLPAAPDFTIVGIGYAFGEVVLHRPGDLFGRLGLDLDHLVVALLVGERTALVGDC